MDPQVQPFVFAFPVIFLAMWLGITTVLAALSGWFGLRSRYPAPAKGEAPLLTLRGHSGSMGLGVHYNGILDLAACPSGLKISVWPIFGPFCRPILIPWDQIHTQPSALYGIVFPHVRLLLGRPQEGKLVIPTILWHRLAEYGPQRFHAADRDADNRALGRGLLIVWIVMSVLAGGFFYAVGSQASAGFPPGLFAFPAFFFGIVMGIHYLRLRWPG